MKCTDSNIDMVFDILKSQMEDENGRGEFDEESDLCNAIETVIAWIEDERGLTDEQLKKKKQPIFERLIKYLNNRNFIEQSGGDIFLNGEFATNFYSKDESTVVHVSVNVWPDEEIIECLKGVE